MPQKNKSKLRPNTVTETKLSTKAKVITVDPITRLEGHGKITIFLNNQGNVKNAYLQVPELRAFEKFCEGRPIEELPRILTRICGVCPGAHHMAAAKTVDVSYHVKPTETAIKLRRLFYNAHIMHSHIAHFYALGAPDFIVGPTSDPAKRNILGVIEKVGLELGKEVIKHRSYAQRIQEIIGGKATHPVAALAGGMSKALVEDERKEIEKMASSMIGFAQTSLKAFDDIVLKNSEYVNLITGDTYHIETYYMGMVNQKNQVDFYDGDIRVVGPSGKEFIKFPPTKYLEHIGEHVEPWTFLKFPFLRKIGWKGLVDGKDSGVYRVGPLGRLNAAEGMETPLAQEEYERMHETLGGKPVHATLAFHWARLIELLQATEHITELAGDPSIIDTDIRNIPTETPGEGIGVVEAPRGTLYHHYISNPEGIAEKVNLIVATGNNNAAICMSIRDAAKKLINKGKVSEGLLNMVEMAFRAYDPCLACATHSLPGQMPLQVDIFDHKNNIYKQVKRAL